jgi:hypothetical protein
MAEPLPEGWWQQGSAESILTKATSITRELSYFQGSKAGRLNDPKASIAFLQRKMPDGTVETKFVSRANGKTLNDYRLKTGRYIDFVGVLIKAEFDDYQREETLSATFSHPYDYKMLPPELVGTNDYDCVVVAISDTPEFLQAVVTNYYPEYTPGIPKKSEFLGQDLIQYISSETDVYIRKSDGIVIGSVKKNKFGKVLDDRVYELVRVNEPIPDAEFILPNSPIQTATNETQFGRIIAAAVKHLRSPATIIRTLFFIGAIVIPAVILYSLTARKFASR